LPKSKASANSGEYGALVALIRQMLPSAALTLQLRPVRGFVRAADALFQEGLLGEERAEQ
jgi:hypothetical protein